MDPFVEMLLWTTLAGACIPIGAGLAHIEHIRSQWLEQEFRHFVIAFGGGVLVGAVALVLVPEGAERLPEPLAVAGLMLAGGGAFMMIDRIQARAKQATPQFTAMAADFLPESLALGGMFAANPEGGVLLALLIGLQNLPEGFNAWHELAGGRLKRRSVLGLMVMLAFLGPVCGLIGWLWLADQDAILGGIMLFASGGILYLMFQDIAPQARLERHWAPPLGNRPRSVEMAGSIRGARSRVIQGGGPRRCSGRMYAAAMGDFKRARPPMDAGAAMHSKGALRRLRLHTRGTNLASDGRGHPPTS